MRCASHTTVRTGLPEIASGQAKYGGSLSINAIAAHQLHPASFKVRLASFTCKPPY
ncbi:MAG: hypothetical protein WKG06_18465 [Segetibacter sp.]